MYYKIKWTDFYTGERITKYVHFSEAREYFIDLDNDPHAVNINAVLVDTVPLTEDDTFGNRW